VQHPITIAVRKGARPEHQPVHVTAQTWCVTPVDASCWYHSWC
jgi:hypothetical protein